MQDSKAAAPTLAVEGGDSFFKEATIPVELKAQWRDKAGIIAAAYGQFLDVYVPGELDLADGADAFLSLVKTHKVPVIAANLVGADGKALFPPSTVKTVGSVRVLVVGAVDPVLFPRDGAVRATDALAALQSALKDAPEHDVAALIVHADADSAAELAKKLPRFSLVMTSHSGTLFFQPKVIPYAKGSPVEEALTFASSKGGKYVARLKVAYMKGEPTIIGGEARAKLKFDVENAERKAQNAPNDPNAKTDLEKARAALAAQDAHSHADFDAAGLEAAMREDKAIAERVTTYNNLNAAREAAYAAAQAPVTSEIPPASPYAGINTCKQCHQTAYEVWTQMDHSHAMASLRKSNQQLDRECVGCHSTGYQQVGGYADPARMGPFAEVQCEACHGASREHAMGKARANRAAGEAVCRKCHTKEATPQFVFDRDRLRIKHWSGN